MRLGLLVPYFAGEEETLKVIWLLQGHPASKWQSQESQPGSLHQAPLSTPWSNRIVTTQLGRAPAQALWQHNGVPSPEWWARESLPRKSCPSGDLEDSAPGCEEQERVL